MTRAALIVLDQDMLDVRVVGLAWPEFQMRRAVAAGAQHLVVVADRVPALLVKAIDRIRAGGSPVTLVRHAADAADLFHPEESVLLLAGLAIVDANVERGLLDQGEAAVLCLPAARDPRFETIDAKLRWTGVACVQGAQVRATTARSGDWDLGSTLMREALQARATRVILPDDAALFLATDPDASARVARAAMAESGDGADGIGTAFLAIPTARAAVLAAQQSLPVAASLAPPIAIALLACGVAATIWFPPWAGFATLFGGALTSRFASMANAATLSRSRLVRYVDRIRDAAMVVALGIVTSTPKVDYAPLVLAAVLVIVTAMARQFGALRLGGDVVAYLMVLAVGAIFDTTGFTWALALCVAYAFATLFRQQRTALAAS